MRYLKTVESYTGGRVRLEFSLRDVERNARPRHLPCCDVNWAGNSPGREVVGVYTYPHSQDAPHNVDLAISGDLGDHAGCIQAVRMQCMHSRVLVHVLLQQIKAALSCQIGNLSLLDRRK